MRRTKFGSDHSTRDRYIQHYFRRSRQAVPSHVPACSASAFCFALNDSSLSSSFVSHKASCAVPCLLPRFFCTNGEMLLCTSRLSACCRTLYCVCLPEKAASPVLSIEFEWTCSRLHSLNMSPPLFLGGLPRRRVTSHSSCYRHYLSGLLYPIARNICSLHS